MRATARLTEALLNNPGLQGTPAARPPTVASPVAHDRRLASPASIQAPAAATVLIGRTTVLQCYALLLASLRFLHTVKHFQIVSYRIAIFCVISYRIESCPLWLYRAITNRYSAPPHGRLDCCSPGAVARLVCLMSRIHHCSLLRLL